MKIKKIVLTAEAGITFDVTKEGETFFIKAKNADEEEIVKEEYYGNYTTPPIPNGYKYVSGEWNTGFVIEKCHDGSKFVWIPVGSYDKEFGFCKNNSENQEEKSIYRTEYINQVDSVEKYGGFYVSSCLVSKNERSGMAQSISGFAPWTNIDSNTAYKEAYIFEPFSDCLKSHLLLNVEYDAIMEWMVYSMTKLVEEGKIDFKPNGLYDFAGDFLEMVLPIEKSRDISCRAGNTNTKKRYKKVKSSKTGFRIALWIK